MPEIQRHIAVAFLAALSDGTFTCAAGSPNQQRWFVLTSPPAQILVQSGQRRPENLRRKSSAISIHVKSEIFRSVRRPFQNKASVRSNRIRISDPRGLCCRFL